jgi:uncharacterized protein (TIGR04255 family)
MSCEGNSPVTETSVESRSEPSRLAVKPQQCTCDPQCHSANRNFEDAEPAMTTAYQAAPIVEAVVEIIFCTPISDSRVQQIAHKIGRFYPNRLNQKTRGVEVNVAAGIANFLDSSDVVALSSADETEGVVITASSVVCRQLAPYCGWDAFFSRLKRDLGAAEKILSARPIRRIGMRFINRIDLLASEKRAFPNDYVTISLGLPPHFQCADVASIACQADYGARPLRVVLNAGFADSPIPAAKAIILDIDVIEETTLPSDYMGVYELLTIMRGVKNEIFEASITPYARERFKNEK